MHRNVLRRRGFGLVGGEVLTKSRLREMLRTEEEACAIVNQVMVIGKDVRSTPMQMSYEQKKLTCAVKHLHWRPPWVKPLDDAEEDPGARYLGSNTLVEDHVGLGRVPGFWSTLNCSCLLYTSDAADE